MKTICYLNPDLFDKKLREVKRGAVFSLSYFSKKDNKVVTRNAQRGVKKYLKGIGKGYTDKEKGLFTYYDTTKLSYRSPRLENIRKFKYGKVTYIKADTINQDTRIATSMKVDF